MLNLKKIAKNSLFSFEVHGKRQIAISIKPEDLLMLYSLEGKKIFFQNELFKKKEELKRIIQANNPNISSNVEYRSDVLSQKRRPWFAEIMYHTIEFLELKKLFDTANITFFSRLLESQETSLREIEVLFFEKIASDPPIQTSYVEELKDDAPVVTSAVAASPTKPTTSTGKISQAPTIDLQKQLQLEKELAAAEALKIEQEQRLKEWKELNRQKAALKRNHEESEDHPVATAAATDKKTLSLRGYPAEGQMFSKNVFDTTNFNNWVTEYKRGG